MWIVSDFRLLNKKIICDKVAIPDIKKTLEQLSDSQVYSLLDFSKAFNQIENTSKAREKPVIVIEYKNYRCLTILFGSTGAPGTFAKDIWFAFRELLDIIANHFDDRIVYSK